MVVFIRIDDRLIHGQVVEGWVNYLKASCLLIADDTVASNSLQCSIMELAVPQGIKVMIGPVDEICRQLRTPALDAERVILLFSNPVDVLRAIKAGMECTSLNVGGMHFVPGKRKLMDVLAVNDGDLEALRKIADKGIKINVQTVPTQRPIPLGKILAACALGK